MRQSTRAAASIRIGIRSGAAHHAPPNVKRQPPTDSLARSQTIRVGLAGLGVAGAVFRWGGNPAGTRTSTPWLTRTRDWRPSLHHAAYPLELRMDLLMDLLMELPVLECSDELGRHCEIRETDNGVLGFEQ